MPHGNLDGLPFFSNGGLSHMNGFLGGSQSVPLTGQSQSLFFQIADRLVGPARYGFGVLGTRGDLSQIAKGELCENLRHLGPLVHGDDLGIEDALHASELLLRHFFFSLGIEHRGGCLLSTELHLVVTLGHDRELRSLRLDLALETRRLSTLVGDGVRV